MISIRNKSLFATILMAITLARAAPLQDSSTTLTGETHLIDTIPEHHIKDSPLELGNHSMHIVSPTGNNEHHHHHHHTHHRQAQVVPSGENYATELSEEIPSNGEELAEHIINLRDYIETLSEDEFDSFLEHYMENGSKDDMFALELALDLDADDRDAEEDHDDSDPWDRDEDDDDAIKFVPYSKIHGGPHSHHRHHRQRLHNHRLQHRFEQELGCDEEEIAAGLCEPSLEFEQNPPRHHGHHYHGHHHELEDELMCTPAEIEQGICGEFKGYHHRQSHLRHGEEIYEKSSGVPAARHHHHEHRIMLKADGMPLGEKLTQMRHNQHLYDADLMGKPQVHEMHKPFAIAIVEHAVNEVGSAHPVKIAEIKVQEVPSLAPRTVDEVSSLELDHV